MSYDRAYEVQLEQHGRVLRAREAGDRLAGVLLSVEHDPVITVSKRPGAADHVLASEELLARQGVALAKTDRGGDVTYHGPGQLVVYPVFDLQRMGVRLHEHLRLLEQAVIDSVASYGVAGVRDADATGVWVERPGSHSAKLCAIGVRVRKWISMHGLALNVSPDLGHFGLIVPCGLHGRPVTSLAELTKKTPAFAGVRDRVVASVRALYEAHASAASGAVSRSG